MPEPLAVMSVPGVRSVRADDLPLATLGAVAAVLLIYVSSSFQLADVFGVKRQAQVLLIVPIGAVAAYFVVSLPRWLLDPLIFFAVLKLVTEIVMRGARPSFVVDSICAVLACAVIACVPTRSFETAARILVIFSGLLALMAFVQMLLIANYPQLLNYVLEPVDEGEVQDHIRHPIALLGLSLAH